MKDAQDVIPWKVTDISLRPYVDLWSMNPSIIFDGTLWLCVLRCCDYSMPSGITVRSKGARAVGQQTKNAMVIFDPKSWKPIQIYKMHEKDGLPRASTPHVGYEDMRIFRTDKGGLQGIAASLHLEREKRTGPAMDGAPRSQPPEQVVLSFDDEYNITSASPIRGPGWSGAQKNWVPFNDVAEARFLYSIDKGRIFDDRGPVHGDAAVVRPSTRARSVASSAVVVGRSTTEAPLEASPPQEEHAREREEDRPAPAKHPDRRTRIRGGDARIVRGGRMKLDAGSARPSARSSSRSSSSASSRPATARSTDDSTRMMGSGRMLLPTYAGLRGGTQLIRVGDDAWLGIGHEMQFVGGKKYYWHVIYTVDSRGKLIATSDPMKLAPNGIEFAAGMAIDGDRVVVSFGVDDMNAMLGETSLSAVMEILRPIT